MCSARCERRRRGATYDVDRVAQRIDAPRDRIVRALDYLAEQGWIELKAEGTRNQYRLLKSPTGIASLAKDLHGRTVQREQREIARLQQVLDLVRHDGCQVAALCEHFGETLARDCGHCTWCLDAERAYRRLPEREAAPIDDSLIGRALALREQKPDVFKEPIILARFLCGVTSPAVSRARLSSNPLFGALAHVPLAEVQSRLE
jgi:ATP-dependent DNA helicase RecQ